jgi:hypothetical protein
MPIQATAVTRLGISGGIWNRLGGDYSNKAASPPVFTGTIPDITGTEGDADIITDLSTYFSGATSYSIAPTVEAGWDFDTSTGILTVDTDDVNTFGTYVVTGTNAAGSDDSNAFSVIISAATVDAGGQRGPITLGVKKKRKTYTPRPTKEEEYYLSKEFVEKLEQGVIEVAGVEVVLQEPIEIPKPLLQEQLPELKTIKDEVEREIAQLMRAKEVAEYETKVKEYVTEMRQMEMKMYFIALALLDEDF